MSECKLDPTQTNDAAIIVRGIRKNFGKLKALDGIDLTVPRSSVVAVLGPNGAGKTTLVRIITTLLQPDEGEVVVAGCDVVRDPAAVRRNIGLAGQYPAVDDILTGKENLEMVGRLYHMGRTDARLRARELLERFDLTQAANRRVKTYSGGMRRRLDLAASIVSKPPLVLLDEPTTGLDPRSRIVMWEIIEDLVKSGTTVFLSTQYLEEADRLADRIAVLNKGRIIREGTSGDLKACCGGDVLLQVQLADPAQIDSARSIIERFSDGGVETISDTDHITSSLHKGTPVLPEIIRELDSSGIRLADLSLRQPTLNDVFLALTGSHAESEETDSGNGHRDE